MDGTEYARKADELHQEALLLAVGSALAARVPDDQVQYWVAERIHEVNLDASRHWADWFLEGAQAVLDDDTSCNDAFEDGLLSYWGDALSYFYLVARQSSDIGQWYAEQVRDVAEVEADRHFLAQRNLQVRACRTAFETHYLLAGGFPSAAEARARTLYELAVVALVIGESDDPQVTADRFLRHSICEQLEDKRSLLSVVEPTEDELDALRVVEREVSDLRAKFGAAYTHDWGWASHLIKGRTTFRALEALAGHGESRPAYRRLCHAVHAGTSGTEDVMDWLPGGPVFAIARSDQLRAIPAVVALSSLNEVTRALLSCRRDPETHGRGLCWIAGIQELSERSIGEFIRREELMHDAIGRMQQADADG